MFFVAQLEKLVVKIQLLQLCVIWVFVAYLQMMLDTVFNIGFGYFHFFCGLLVFSFGLGSCVCVCRGLLLCVGCVS